MRRKKNLPKSSEKLNVVGTIRIYDLEVLVCASANGNLIPVFEDHKENQRIMRYKAFNEMAREYNFDNLEEIMLQSLIEIMAYVRSHDFEMEKPKEHRH